MKRWGWLFVCVLLVFSLALSGCQTSVDTSETPSESVPETSDDRKSSGTTDEPEGDTPANYSKFDLDASWKGSDTFLRCSGGSVDMEGRGATFDSGKLSIRESGTYILSGDLEGQIYIEVDEAEKVHLVFNGFSLSCADYSPLYCEEADKISITLADGTENSVTDNGSGYVQGMNSGRIPVSLPRPRKRDIMFRRSQIPVWQWQVWSVVSFRWYVAVRGISNCLWQ